MISYDYILDKEILIKADKLMAKFKPKKIKKYHDGEVYVFQCGKAKVPGMMRRVTKVDPLGTKFFVEFPIFITITEFNEFSCDPC